MDGAKAMIGMILGITVFAIIASSVFPIGLQQYHSITKACATDTVVNSGYGMTANEWSIWSVQGIFLALTPTLILIMAVMREFV